MRPARKLRRSTVKTGFGHPIVTLSTIPYLQLIQLPCCPVNDVRDEIRIWRLPHDDEHALQTAACSFSLSRGSRVRHVPTRPACGEPGRKSLEVRHRRTRECDALRRSPDTLTRITRLLRGLPVRSWGTRDCRLPSSSSPSAQQLRMWTLAEARGTIGLRSFLIVGRTGGSVRAECTKNR